MALSISMWSSASSRGPLAAAKAAASSRSESSANSAGSTARDPAAAVFRGQGRAAVERSDRVLEEGAPGHRAERARSRGKRRDVAGGRTQRCLDTGEGHAFVKQQHLQALAYEGERLGDDRRAALIVKPLDALEFELVHRGGEEAAEGEPQAVLERDAHDAHRGAAQAVGIA